MAKYIKDGVVYDSITSIKLNGKLIINPRESQIIAAGYEVYDEDTANTGITITLEGAINDKITQIVAYADSDERNSYVAMGVTIRLSQDLRSRLRDVIDSKISLGETTLTEWYEGVNYTYPLTVWDKQLSQYENYLYEVSCVAEQHKQNVRALATVDGVNAYDYTTGYPEQLNFDIDNRTDEEKLADVKTAKINELSTHVDSDELNSYVAQGVTIRLPLELRLRLRNVIDAKISLGETMLTEWYDGVSYTYPLTAWDVQLAQYENYLYEVSCVAMQHKQNIRALTTIEEVEEYDYTTGYPEQLNFGTYDDGSSNNAEK